MIMSSGSTEYVLVPVSGTAAGAAVDLSATTVKMAFVVADATPASGDLHAADWETDSTTVPPTYYARCLVGPDGDVVLPAGAYGVWVQVTDSPEKPLIPCGLLTVS